MEVISESRSENIVVKRRSLIFHTKVTSFDETKDNFPDHMNIYQQESIESGTHETNFDFRDYIQKLKDERRCWEQMLIQRKSQRRELAKQKSKIDIQGQTLDMANFSEPEKSFLSLRPNYDRIYKNQKKLSKDAIKMAILNQHLNKLNIRFVSGMERKLHDVTKKVINMANILE